MAKTPKIKFYNSVVKGKVPNAEDAEIGEIFINANAEAPFISTKNSNGEMTKYIDEATIDQKIAAGGLDNQIFTTIAASLNDLNGKKLNESAFTEYSASTSSDIDGINAKINGIEQEIQTGVTSAITQEIEDRKNADSKIDSKIDSNTELINTLSSETKTKLDNKVSIDSFESEVNHLTTMIDTKQPLLVSGENIKTINGTSLIGSGNIDIESGTKITVDIVMSDVSENAVQNKVIKSYVDTNKVTKTSQLANDSGFLTQHQDISGKLDKTEAALTYQTKGDYALKSDIYDKSVLDEKLALKANASDLNYKLDSSDFQSYSAETNTKINSKADASDVYTKTQVDSLLTSSTVTKEIESIISGYSYSKNDVDTKVNEKADKTTVDTLSGKVDSKVETKEYSAYTASTETKISNKADTTTVNALSTKIDTISGNVETLSGTVANKQDTLVSGTNIKTINNQSLLGEGNITIEGGSTITVDKEMSKTSENPVQNKVITATLDNYALASDIPTKTSQLTNDSGFLSEHQDISGKLDTSVFENYSADTDSKITDKQDVLVSGTNIKTINNQSLLGEGNITIEGGGSITIDDSMSDTSENAVQNKVIKSYVDSNKVTKTSELTNDSNYIVNGTSNDVTFNGNVYLSGSTHIPSEIKAEGNLKMTSDFALGKECLFKTKALMANTIYTEKLAYSSGNTSTGTIYTSYTWDLPHKSGTIALTSDIPSTTNFVQTSAFTSYSASTADSINKKLNTTDFNTYSAETNTKINAKVNVDDVYTKTEVDEKVDNIVTSSTISEKIQTVVSSYTYSQSDIDTKLSDKSDRTELATVSAATQNSIDTISGTATTLRTDLDTLSGFTGQLSAETWFYLQQCADYIKQNSANTETISGNVETLSGTVANKQDTLVSGTNIKTINNQSLLGEGNITIEGGGSVTVDTEMSDVSENPVQNKVITAAIKEKPNVVYLTQAEYDALETKDTSKIYMITDAKEVESLDDYYTKTEVDTKLSEKADTTALAAKQDTLVSGTNIKTINNETLLGSGNIVVPKVWSGTQTEYDAITTKDSGTIYLIYES